MTNLRLSKVVLYRLKRSYGLPVQIRRVLTEGYNLETGGVSRTYEIQNLRRAVVLPVKVWQEHAAHVIGSQPFRYGAYYDPESRVCIVDVPITDKHQIIFEGDVYELSNPTIMPGSTSTLVHMKKVENAQ